ncbi:alpha/beta fold hydrolase [Azospirillum sp. TSO35-2]|uniref:alpha/beta fold hydrolase n=1 Tax=Azospirillum sp. TSO35-2 TaxID=716796 RepID=UPI001FFE9F71|nr:alpha/beta fold hydrolase [Azospirillum sp. TSO35-2]
MAGVTAYRDIGQGTPLVLIHGVGLCKEVWEPQIAAFASTRRVIVYDMLGHGESGLESSDGGLDAFVAQLARLLDHLGIDGADIVGHSMGALVALGFAIAHPRRVRRLVALNAVYDRPDEQRAAVLDRAAEIDRIGPRSAAGRAIGRWFGDEPAPDLVAKAETVRGWLENANPIGYARAYRVFASGDRAHVGRLGGLTMPVLYLTGDLDLNSSPAMSRRMAAETPDGRALSLPGERHMMALVSPDLVNDALRDFIDDGAT